MKYYAVSDVHGYYTRLRSTLEEAGFFTDIEPRKLILCGGPARQRTRGKTIIRLYGRALKAGFAHIYFG